MVLMSTSIEGILIEVFDQNSQYRKRETLFSVYDDAIVQRVYKSDREARRRWVTLGGY